MGQRHMMIDLEIDQQARGYLHPEPCVFTSIVPSYPRHDIQPMIPAPGIFPNPETQYLPDPYKTPMFYGFPQYHAIQHHYPNLDLNVAMAPNFCSPYVFPHGPPSHLPSSSHYGGPGVASNESQRNSDLMDTANSLCRIQYAVETLTSPQNLNPPAAPSFNFTPTNILGGASFALPQFRGMDETPLMKVGIQRSVQNGLGMNPFIARSQNDFVQGNYRGQSFPPPGTLWFDQELSNNGRNDGIPSQWSNPPSAPYINGNDVASGSIKPRMINLQGYHRETSSNRNSAAFAYSPSLNPRHHYFAHLPPHGMQGMRSNMNPVAETPVQPRVPVSYTTQSTLLDDLEMGSAQMRPIQATSLRIYGDNREGHRAEPILRHQNLPRLRFMPADEVALLEDGDSSDPENDNDRHRDMRLDIEDMSYEELLALSERIGTVKTGLSEDKVATLLKTRLFLSSEINLEEVPPLDQETDFCIICQENYKNLEIMGTLGCGHEYHADCLKKWLVVKNVCPICKSEALVPERKDQ